MAANIKQLRSRIKSVDSTLHLTNAMGLVASSKIRRAMDTMAKSRQYLDSFQNIMDFLLASPECGRSVYMRPSSGERTRLIVTAGDRGLAGGYNANIFRLAGEYPDAEVFPIGKRACDKFGPGISSAERFSYDDAIALSEKLCSEYSNGVFDRLGILGTRYVSILTQEAYIRWIFPLQKTEGGEKTHGILFEPDEMTMLDAIIPEYTAGVLLAVVRESFMSEVAARRTAMDSAGKNAQKMIDDLFLEYNRARQSAITQEITEIVAGGDS